jgi:hypothetical protein
MFLVLEIPLSTGTFHLTPNNETAPAYLSRNSAILLPLETFIFHYAKTTCGHFFIENTSLSPVSNGNFQPYQTFWL